MLSACVKRCVTRAIACRLPSATMRSRAALASDRRPAEAASGENGAAPASRSTSAARRLPTRSAMRALTWLRAEAMASGSTSRPISRAISASPGSCSTWARKAASSASFSATSASASMSSTSKSTISPRAASAAPAVSERMASVCAACQRLNGSASVLSRKSRSASERSMLSLTGAEKPRSSEGTGRLETPWKTIVWLSSVSWITSPSTRPPAERSKARSSPLAPTRPKRTGMCCGCLLGWPGVGGHDCSSVSA